MRPIRQRRTSGFVPAGVMSVCLVLAGCSAAPEQSQAPAPAAAPAAAPASAAAPETATVARHDLKGKVLSVDKAGKTVTVDHEEIPGFMAAMTMPYAVKDEALLDTLAPGDLITAKVVTEGGYHLEDVVVTGKAAPAK